METGLNTSVCNIRGQNVEVSVMHQSLLAVINRQRLQLPVILLNLDGVQSP